jgi:3-methylcrotonyl-CoA carboxylase alpha subunit
VNYEGAGTIEFIADASDGLRADRIWFMEMNTRLQVEHPVTEAVTGPGPGRMAAPRRRRRAAAAETGRDLADHGWAMEARLYAEDPANGFLPSIGRLEHFVMPEGIRVDTGVEQGGEVSQFYDPMIAKLIVHAETRPKRRQKTLAEAAPVRSRSGRCEPMPPSSCAASSIPGSWPAMSIPASSGRGAGSDFRAAR